MVVHAGGQAGIAIVLERVGRRRDDAGVAVAVSLPDACLPTAKTLAERGVKAAR